MKFSTGPYSWRTVLLVLVIAALVVVPLYAAKGTVVLVIAGALTLANIRLALTDLRCFLTQPIGGALALFMIWAAVTLIWSPGGSKAAWIVLTVAALFLLGFAFATATKQLKEAPARIAGNALIAAMIIMIALFLFEALSGGALIGLFNKNNVGDNMNIVGHGTTILAVLIWPALTIVRNRTRSWLAPVALLIPALVAALLLPIFSSFVALSVGAIAFFIMPRIRRPVIAVLFSGVAVFSAVSPWFFLHVFNLEILQSHNIEIGYSHHHRLKIWHFVSGKVQEHPIIGHGFGSARVIGQQQQRKYNELEAEAGRTLPITDLLLPLHPHDVPLQIWLELGAVGILLYIGILFGIARFLWHSTDPPVWVAGAGATALSYLTVSLFSFGVWQNWWLAVAWLGAALSMLARRAVHDEAPSIP